MKSAGKAADLAQPAVAKGVEWRKLEGDIKGELTLPEVLLPLQLTLHVLHLPRSGEEARAQGEEDEPSRTDWLAPR